MIFSEWKETINRRRDTEGSVDPATAKGFCNNRWDSIIERHVITFFGRPFSPRGDLASCIDWILYYRAAQVPGMWTIPHMGFLVHIVINLRILVNPQNEAG
jgi:hypothetical protein